MSLKIGDIFIILKDELDHAPVRKGDVCQIVQAEVAGMKNTQYCYYYSVLFSTYIGFNHRDTIWGMKNSKYAKLKKDLTKLERVLYGL